MHTQVPTNGQVTKAIAAHLKRLGLEQLFNLVVREGLWAIVSSGAATTDARRRSQARVARSPRSDRDARNGIRDLQIHAFRAELARAFLRAGFPMAAHAARAAGMTGGV